MAGNLAKWEPAFLRNFIGFALGEAAPPNQVNKIPNETAPTLDAFVHDRSWAFQAPENCKTSGSRWSVLIRCLILASHSREEFLLVDECRQFPLLTLQLLIDRIGRDAELIRDLRGA